MTPRQFTPRHFAPKHLNDEHHHWTHVVDYETLWVLVFSAVVISSGIFGLLSIAQNNPQPFP